MIFDPLPFHEVLHPPVTLSFQRVFFQVTLEIWKANDLGEALLHHLVRSGLVQKLVRLGHKEPLLLLVRELGLTFFESYPPEVLPGGRSLAEALLLLVGDNPGMLRLMLELHQPPPSPSTFHPLEELNRFSSSSSSIEFCLEHGLEKCAIELTLLQLDPKLLCPQVLHARSFSTEGILKPPSHLTLEEQYHHLSMAMRDRLMEFCLFYLVELEHFPDPAIRRGDYLPETLLNLSLLSPDPDLLDLVLRYLPNPSLVDRDGRNALMMAIRTQNLERFEKLVSCYPLLSFELFYEDVGKQTIFHHLIVHYDEKLFTSFFNLLMMELGQVSQLPGMRTDPLIQGILAKLATPETWNEWLVYCLQKWRRPVQDHLIFYAPAFLAEPDGLLLLKPDPFGKSL